jgi:hypothetical protein
MREPLRFPGRIMGAVVSRTADRWYVAVQVEVADPAAAHRASGSIVGIDVGIASLMSLSQPLPDGRTSISNYDGGFGVESGSSAPHARHAPTRWRNAVISDTIASLPCAVNPTTARLSPAGTKASATPGLGIGASSSAGGRARTATGIWTSTGVAMGGASAQPASASARANITVLG